MLMQNDVGINTLAPIPLAWPERYLDRSTTSYLEAIDILYKENFFSFNLIGTIARLPECMPLHRLRLIQYLHLDTQMHSNWPPPNVLNSRRWSKLLTYWDEACRVMASKMSGLRVLHITFLHPVAQEIAIDDETLLTILRPLLAVEVPDFTVELFWPVELCAVMRSLAKEKLPFSIVQHRVQSALR
jgi:hypothetical protein